MKKNGGGGGGENTHELEKNAKMLEKINTIMSALDTNQALSSDPMNWQRASPLCSGHKKEKAEPQFKLNRLWEIAHLYNDNEEECFGEYIV